MCIINSLARLENVAVHCCIMDQAGKAKRTPITSNTINSHLFIKPETFIEGNSRTG